MSGKKYYGYQEIFDVDQKRKLLDQHQPDQNSNIDQRSHSQDQKIDKDQLSSLESISSLEKLDNSGRKISSLENISSLETISRLENISTHQENILTGIKIVKGSTSIPNTLLDSLGELLTTAEQIVFIHLYRLSYGFNKSQCLISLERLGQRTGMSGRNVQNVIKTLERKALIKKIGHNIGAGKLQGIVFHVENIGRVENNSRLEIISTLETTSSLETISINKDHHDDLKKQDHHQSKSVNNNLSEHEKSVMTIYQKLTENNWTKTDRANYEKVKHIEIDKIELAIKAAMERAHNSPNSFAYFIKEIQRVANPPKLNRNHHKKALEKIIKRVKNSLVGSSSSYSMSDFVHKIKETCLREDVMFDNDIVNEILNNKNSST